MQFFSDVNRGLAIFWASPSRPDLLLVRPTPHFGWAFVSSVDPLNHLTYQLGFNWREPNLTFGASCFFPDGCPATVGDFQGEILTCCTGGKPW